MAFLQVLPRLKASKFRMHFRLDQYDFDYIEKAGLEKIKEHAENFVRKRLAAAEPLHDGKQTPFKGHPVFKAQHATATCCRGCLYKWHLIPTGRALTHDECQKIVALLLAWIAWQTAPKHA